MFNLNKILKQKEPSKILEDYMLEKINLTVKQLEEVCKLGPHRGGISFEYKNNKTK